MKKTIIQTGAVVAAAVCLLLLMFFLVKTKRLQINRWVISRQDVVGASDGRKRTCRQQIRAELGERGGKRHSRGGLSLLFF